MRQVDDSDVAGVGERRPQIVRLGRLAPVKAYVNELGAEGLHHAGPALAEIAGGEDELAVAGRGQIRHGRFERARAGGGEHDDVVLCAVDVAQPREAALVDLAVVALAMVDNGLGERGEHLGRYRCRPRGEEVAALGHLVLSLAPASARGGRPPCSPGETCLRTNPDRLPLQAVPALDEATSARAAVDEDAVLPRVDARYAEREPLLPEVGELARHATEQDEGLSRRAPRCRLADRRAVVTRVAFWSKRGGNDVDGKASAVAPAAEAAAHADVFCRETQADVSARGWNQRE